MKLKHIVAAVAAAAAVSPAFAVGGFDEASAGDLFLVVWEGSPATPESYSIDLGKTLSSFNPSSSFNLTLSGSDANLTSFLASATTSALKWAVLAGNIDNTSNVSSVLTTVQAGQESQATGLLGTDVQNGQVQIQSLGGYLNQKATLQSGYYSSVDASSSSGFFGKTNMNSLNLQFPFNNSNSIGQSAALDLLQVDPSGDPSLNAALTVEAGKFNLVNTAGTYSLQYSVASVPETDGMVLLSAGLGVLGFVGRRRRAA